MDHIAAAEERIVTERLRQKLNQVNSAAQSQLSSVQDHVNFTLQRAYFKCAYECFDKTRSQEDIGRCTENCSAPVVAAQRLVEDEMAKFQDNEDSEDVEDSDIELIEDKTVLYHQKGVSGEQTFGTSYFGASRSEVGQIFSIPCKVSQRKGITISLVTVHTEEEVPTELEGAPIFDEVVIIGKSLRGKWVIGSSDDLRRQAFEELLSQSIGHFGTEVYT
ncbi:hypothetical protein AgCh_038525 [Apium graveolens]